jgi:hypothetical protein
MDLVAEVNIPLFKDNQLSMQYEINNPTFLDISDTSPCWSYQGIKASYITYMVYLQSMYIAIINLWQVGKFVYPLMIYLDV